MRALTMSSRPERLAATASRSVVEALERRTLFAGWTTVDDFQLVPGESADLDKMTSDSAGNVYAVGAAMDASGSFHGIVRQKLAGSSAWQTVLDVPQLWMLDVATNAAGDVYVRGGGTNARNVVLLERPAGASEFVTVDQVTGGTSGGLTVDAANNVFAVAHLPVTVTSSGPGGKTTTSVQNRWVVRKQSGGVGPFVTMPAQFTQTPVAMTSIASGPAAGLYLLGGTGWDVWKSTDAGSSWSHVDSFAEVGGLYGSEAYGISGDVDGNLYVTGTAVKREITGGTPKRPVYSSRSYLSVRRSADGGATWTNDDLYNLPGGTWTAGGEVGVDASGSVYMVGGVTGPNGTGGQVFHNVVRQKLRGATAWATVDDVVADNSGYGFAADPFGGVFVGSYMPVDGGRWIVRSQSVQATAPAATPTFSATAIQNTSTADADEGAGLIAVVDAAGL